MLASNPNIVRTWVETVIENGAWRYELVVETDLETREGMPGFDATKFEAMVQAAADENASGSYERVRVVPAGAR